MIDFVRMLAGYIFLFCVMGLILLAYFIGIYVGGVMKVVVKK